VSGVAAVFCSYRERPTGTAAASIPGTTIYTDGLKKFMALVPLADRAIGNLQQWLHV
jgi:hypothetical protein